MANKYLLTYLLNKSHKTLFRSHFSNILFAVSRVFQFFFKIRFLSFYPFQVTICSFVRCGVIDMRYRVRSKVSEMIFCVTLRHEAISTAVQLLVKALFVRTHFTVIKECLHGVSRFLYSSLDRTEIFCKLLLFVLQLVCLLNCSY